MTNRYLHEVLPTNAWAGRPAYIVGGGPSLKGFDFESLRGHLVITCNKAWEYVPHAAINLTIDSTFMENARSDDAWKAQSSLRVAVANRHWKGHADDPGLFRVDDIGGTTWSDRLELGIGTGWNSGLAAANLAWCLGARPIYLLGMDGSLGWFHDGYDNQEPSPTEGTWRFHSQQWLSLVARVPAGVLMHHRNPGSNLTFFPQSMAPIVERNATRVMCAEALDEQVRAHGLELFGTGGCELALSDRVKSIGPGINYFNELVGSDVDVAARVIGHDICDDVAWFNDTDAAREVKAKWDASGDLASAIMLTPAANILGLLPEYCWHPADVEGQRHVARPVVEVDSPLVPDVDPLVAINEMNDANREARKTREEMTARAFTSHAEEFRSKLPPLPADMESHDVLTEFRADMSLPMVSKKLAKESPPSVCPTCNGGPVESTLSKSGYATCGTCHGNWQPMTYVATLFRPVEELPKWSAYSPEYAMWFAENIWRFSPTANVVIVTDYDSAEFAGSMTRPHQFTTMQFELPHRGWAALMEMFRPDVVGDGHAILMGLDTVVVGDLTKVEDCVRHKENRGWCAPFDPYDTPQITNAVVGVSAVAALDIWQRWHSRQSDPVVFTSPHYQLFGAFSEMKWMRDNLPAPTIFDRAIPGAIVSYKASILAHNLTSPMPSARIVYFHGEPKPQDLLHCQWVRDNWGEHAVAPAPQIAP